MSRAAPPGPRKISFNVSEQYDIQEVIGEGAYGVVWYRAPFSRHIITSTYRGQFRITQAIWSKSCYKEDHTIRALYVLPANVARDEATPIFQPREHYFNLGYTEAKDI